MSLATVVLEIEREGEILHLAPATELDDLDEAQIKESAETLLEVMDYTGVKEAFLDIGGMDSFNPEVARLAAELWRRVGSQGGSMAICLL